MCAVEVAVAPGLPVPDFEVHAASASAAPPNRNWRRPRVGRVRGGVAGGVMSVVGAASFMAQAPVVPWKQPMK